MALQSSGPISLNDIRVELGLAQSNVSLQLMSSQVGFVEPHSISEFYGFTAVVYTPKEITSVGPDAEIMCAYGYMFATQTVYSTTDPIQVNANLYFDTTGGSEFNQGPGWVYEPLTNTSFEVSETGRVLSEVRC